MKSKLFLFFLCSVIVLSANSQITTLASSSQNFISSLNVKTSEGNYLGIEKRFDMASGFNWNKFRNSLAIVQYDGNMKRIKDVKLSSGQSVYSAYYSELKKVGNKYWLIYLEPTSGNDVGNIMALEINPVNLQTSSPITLASKTAIDLGMKFYGTMSKELKIWTSLSPSNSYLSLFVSAGKGDFYLSCFDNQLNSIWQKKESIEKVKDKDISSVVVDNKGNIFLGYTKKSEGYVGIYSKAGTASHQQVIAEDYDIKDVLLSVNRKANAVSVVGSYVANDYCKGVYSATITESLKLGPTRLFAFPEDLPKQLHKEGFASAKKGIEQNYTAKIFELEDGTLTMLAEMQNTIYDRITRTLTGSVIAAHFGKETSFAKIPKYNATGGESGAQYFAQVCGNDVMVFYNDNPDNLSRDISLDAKTLDRNGILIAAQLKADGTFIRKQVTAFGSTESVVAQYLQKECH
jgi:hypothetical protein